MSVQVASSFLMIRPRHFKRNPETSATNVFQVIEEIADAEANAIAEFDHVIKRLRKCGIYILEEENTNAGAPDAVFPNNWISTMPDGTIILYPMQEPSRRSERNSSIVSLIQQQFETIKVIDLTHYEQQNKFLEGTGSIVFDHRNKMAYASISSRTHEEVLDDLCAQTGYRKFVFTSIYKEQPVYHTNVMMHIGEKYAVVCLESVPDVKQRNELRRILAFTGHDLIIISIQQMSRFAGNMLEVENASGKRYTLLSSTAIRCLHLPQINTIAGHSELLSFDIPTIETCGGGSIRCMIAEIFAPVKKVKS